MLPFRATNENEFSYACFNGHLEVAQWLLFIKPTIEVSTYKDAFHNACFNGHLEVAQWLLSIKPTTEVSAGTMASIYFPLKKTTNKGVTV